MVVKSVDKIIEHESHRELVYEGVGDEIQNLSIVLRDSRVNGDTDGYYKIPLYTAMARPQDSSELDVELVHIYPYLHDTLAESDLESSILASGYLYIFVDGFLWRELKVIEETIQNQDFAKFRDVNLAYQKGNLSWKHGTGKHLPGYSGERVATGELLASVLVPHKLCGKETTVEIAWSEIQWSWTQILKFGGLNPQDPRLNYGAVLTTAERKCPDKIEAQKLRNKRMHHLDNLGHYNQYTSVGRVRKSEIIHRALPDPHADSYALTPIFNGVHIARVYLAKIFDKLTDIQYEMNLLAGFNSSTEKTDEKQKATFELASFMFQTFYHQVDSILDGDVDFSGSEIHDEKNNDPQEFAQKLKDWRQDSGVFNETAFLNFFKQNELFDLAQEVADLQNELVAFLRDEQSRHSFVYCFEDYCFHTNSNFSQAYVLLREIFDNLKAHPAAAFAQFVNDEEKWKTLSDEHQGQDFILECLGQHPQKPANRICKMLFPEDLGRNLQDYNLGIESPFSSNFSGKKIINLLEQEKNTDVNEITHLGELLSKSIMGMAVSLFEIPDLIGKISKVGDRSGNSISHQQKVVDQDIEIVNKQILDKKSALNEAEERLIDSENRLDILQKEYEKQYGQNTISSDVQTQNLIFKIKIQKQRVFLAEQSYGAARASLLKVESSKHYYIKNKNQWQRHSHARFIHAKVNVMLPLLRVIDIAHPNEIIQTRMSVFDYTNGNFDPRYIPLDTNARKHQAKVSILEIDQIVREHHKRFVNVHTHNGRTAKFALEDTLLLNSRLSSLMNILNSGSGNGGASTQLMNDVFVIKLRAEDPSLGTEINEANEQVKNDKVRSNQIATSIVQEKEILDKLKAKRKSLQKWIDFGIPPRLSVSDIKSGTGSLLGVVAVFEVINFTNIVRNFDVESFKSYEQLILATLGLINTGISLYINAANMKIGMPGRKQTKRYHSHVKKKPNTTLTNKWGLTFFQELDIKKVSNRIGLLTSVYSLKNIGFDSYYSFKRGDIFATSGLIVAGVGEVVSAGSIIADIFIRSAKNPFSKLGWAGLIVTCAGYTIYYFFKDEPIKAWLKNCPWGSNPYGGGTTDFFGDNIYYIWQEYPEYAMEALYNHLFLPQLSGEREVIPKPGPSHPFLSNDIHQAYFTLAVPGHDPAQSVENFDFEFAIRPDRWGAEWEIINASSSSGNINSPQDKFWNGVSIFLNVDLAGYKIVFDANNLADYFEKFDTRFVEVRLRYKYFPKGLNVNLSSRVKQHLVLPVSDRNESGELIDSELCSEAIVKLRK